MQLKPADRHGHFDFLVPSSEHPIYEASLLLLTPHLQPRPGDFPLYLPAGDALLWGFSQLWHLHPLLHEVNALQHGHLLVPQYLLGFPGSDAFRFPHEHFNLMCGLPDVLS